MTDPRLEKFAHILVDHSARIQPGDRVLLEGTTAAIPLIEELYKLILQRGGHPYPALELPQEQQIFFEYASEEQLLHIPTFRKYAYEKYESRIRIHSSTDTRALSHVDPAKQAIRNKVVGAILETQMLRGAAGQFKWVTTLFPTQAYADEAGLTLPEFEDFVYQAVHTDKNDPVAYWKKVEKEQQKIIDHLKGHNRVELRGPNVDLTLSIKDRIFMNAAGEHNLPDGEIFTGPVEDSVNGWVRYTYPAITGGRVVEGIELEFTDGMVTRAASKSNQDFLHQMLDTDPGARYVGEFAIGTNFEINRFTGNILFDEKIGGSFHMALGAGYPDTGSLNKSLIHWDMICDMRNDSRILVDDEVIYQNGQFTI
jgi:aminopeptidase